MELNDNKQFELLFHEKNYKKIINILTNLLVEVSKEQNTNVEVKTDTSKIESLLSTINKQPDFSDIPKSIKSIGDAITKKLEYINIPKPLVDSFTVIRGEDRIIEKVKVNYKS